MKVEFIGGPCDGTVLEGEAAEGTIFLVGYDKMGSGAIGRRVVIPPVWTREILSRGSRLSEVEATDPRVRMHLIYEFENVDPFRLRFIDARGVSTKKATTSAEG